jgi:hypothetical protein
MFAVVSALVFWVGRGLAPAAVPASAPPRPGSRPHTGSSSRAGALAAADDYVLVEQQSVEQDPARETRLIDTADAASYRQADARSAAADRERDPAGMVLWAHGGRSVTVIAAHRLDYYRPGAVQVTTWTAQIFWGAGRAPQQSWGLGQTTLQWTGGRWFVTSDVALATGAPVPASTPQSTAANGRPALFTAELAGFADPVYGAASR